MLFQFIAVGIENNQPLCAYTIKLPIMISNLKYHIIAGFVPNIPGIAYRLSSPNGHDADITLFLL